MTRIDLKITHPFISKNPPRNGQTTDLGERVLHRLFSEGLDPGEVRLLALNDGGDYRILGAFTLNMGGSISFFPDFVNQLKVDYVYRDGEQKDRNDYKTIDHITLNRDFLQKGGHSTGFFGGKRTRPEEHAVADLKGLPGYFCWFTILIADPLMLNDLHPELHVSAQMEVKDELALKERINKLMGMNLQVQLPQPVLPGKIGCVQVFVVEKGYAGKMQVLKDHFDAPVCGVTNMPTGAVPTMSSRIELGARHNFDLHLVGFVLEGKPTDPLLLINSFDL